MPRQIHTLSFKKVEALKLPGRYSDGGGLYLSIGKDGQRRWVFLYDFKGRRREMGLGSASRGGVSLADARRKAEDAQRLKRDGTDPLDAKRDQARVEDVLLVSTKSFGQLADEYIDTHAAGWRNDKHVAQWRMTLTRYAAPLRGKAPDAIMTEDILAVLKPIWLTKPETAQRLRGRIEAVLSAATSLKLREGPNPALWRGHLSNLLPKEDKSKRGHHAALPYAALPEFMASLRVRQSESMAAFALELCILTATRTSEVINATWSEFDPNTAMWTIPVARMKAKREHRVPLSPQVVALLRRLHQLTGSSSVVFSSTKVDRPLSNMAMDMLLRRMGCNDITVHGFRSTFSDWVSEQTSFSSETREQALAHTIGNKVDAAYRRGDLFEKRRDLMNQWATFCEPARTLLNTVNVKSDSWFS